MSRVHVAHLAYNRGECSRTALARVDVEKMRLAAECQVNWQPSALGAMSLRSGLGYMFSTRSDAAAFPIPFVFGINDKAFLELTDSHLRVVVSDALVTRPSVSTAVQNGTFAASTGWVLTSTAIAIAAISSNQLTLDALCRGAVCTATQTVTVAGGDQNVEHALRIVITRGPVTFFVGSSAGKSDYVTRSVLGTGTHSLTFTPAGNFIINFETTTRPQKIVTQCSVEAAGTLDLPTPWVASDLSKIRFHQSGDIVFIACDGYQQRKIERRSTTGWSVVLYESDDGPFTPAISDHVTLTPSVYEGTGTLTASRAIFKQTLVGALVRIFTPGQTWFTTLGVQGTTSGSLRIAGIGAADRGFTWVVGGVWVGTVALQRSVEGPDTGFKEVATTTVNASTAVDDHATYDNVVVWYRIAFKTYTSGTADVSFTGTTVADRSEQGGQSDSPTSTTSGAAQSGTSGICRIVSYSSETVVAIEVLKPFSSISASADWMMSDWSAYNGWPTDVRFYEGRLWWFRGDRRWASVSDNYYSFDIDVEGDSGTINRSFGSGPVDKINGVLDLQRLIICREGSIDPVRSSSFDEPLTPTNNVTKSCSNKGAAELPPLKVGSRGIYVEKSGRRVYELVYNVEAQDYGTKDLTRLNLDIGLAGFTSLAAQEQPDTFLHLVRGDGQDAPLMYEPGEDIACWWRVMTLGVIERVMVLPGSIEDSVYYVVKRTINGSTKRYWEKQAVKSQCVGGSLCRLADSYIAVSQASSTTISGLSHLEGATVVVWANGKDLGSYTVSGAAITVSEAVTTAIVGLGGVTYSYDNSSTASATLTASSAYNGYPAEVFASGPQGGRLRYVGAVPVSGGVITLPNGKTAKKIIAYLGYYGVFRSAKLAYGAQMGTALAQSKAVEGLGLIAYDTHYQGIQWGAEIDNLQPLPLTLGGQDITAHTVFDEHDEPIVGLSRSWNTDERLHLLGQAPRPATISGVVVAVNTSESR